ncbi:MAG: hypothetical protein KG028_12345 [Actinobacteria bacterium]|nr:hypothetical protein [Actinomycetota bacterium]
MNRAASPTARPRVSRGRAASSRRSQGGSLSLEAVFVLPVIALLALGLLNTVTVLRDVLLLHEAARVGARVAATSTDRSVVANAARAAAPELAGIELTVTPPSWEPGDVVTVRVSATRRVGSTSLALRATAHARAEPTLGEGIGGHPFWQPGQRNVGPLQPWTSGTWAGLVDDGPAARSRERGGP